MVILTILGTISTSLKKLSQFFIDSAKTIRNYQRVFPDTFKDDFEKLETEFLDEYKLSQIKDDAEHQRKFDFARRDLVNQYGYSWDDATEHAHALFSMPDIEPNEFDQGIIDEYGSP